MDFVARMVIASTFHLIDTVEFRAIRTNIDRRRRVCSRATAHIHSKPVLTKTQIPAPARILLVDSGALFRDALRKLLETDSEFVVVGDAADADDALRLTTALKPDILLLNWAMPDGIGEIVLRALGAETLRTRVIVLTAEIEQSTILNALQWGARGVVLKASGYADLFKAIRCVMSGQYWVGRESLAGLVDVLRRASATGATAKSSKAFGLTKRECDIISAILDACTNKDIAERYSISEKTVKHHLTHIFEKVGVSNRLELAMFAQAHNFQPNDSPSPGHTLDQILQG
jgi:two-component system nitrate/nitrite response regulator NarL